MREIIKVTLTLALLGTAACGSDSSSNSVDCSAKDAPTYETFGKPFFDDYCASCHAATVMGAARMGAPNDDVFDTLDQIQKKADEVQAEAVDSEKMPFGPTSKKPTAEERKMLGDWLECGAK